MSVMLDSGYKVKPHESYVLCLKIAVNVCDDDNESSAGGAVTVKK